MSYQGRGRGGGDRGGDRGRGGGGGYRDSPRGDSRGGGGDYRDSPRGDSRGDSRGGGSRGGYGGDRGGSRGSRGGSRDVGPAPVDILLKNPPVENERLRRFEDACVKESLSMVVVPPTPGEKHLPPRRPQYGTIGKPIIMRVDFLELNFIDNNKTFYSYAVKFSPTPDRPRIKKEILDRVLRMPNFKRVFAASDMAQEIVTYGPLQDTSDVVVSLPGSRGETRDFKLSFDNAGDPKESRALKETTPSKILDQLSSSKQPYPIPHEESTTRMLNIALTRTQFWDPGMVTTGKGRQKFFWIDQRKQYADLGGGLEVIRGFFSSVRVGTDRLLLNLNVNHGTFYRPAPLSELTDAFVREYGEDRDLFNRYIKGLRIQVTHLPHEKDATGKMGPRLKSCWGVATPKDGNPKEAHSPKVARLGSSPSNVQFWEEDKKDSAKGDSGKGGSSKGAYISVSDYFKRVYKMSNLGRRPVVNVGSNSRPSYLPQDVCIIPPGVPFSGELCTSQRQAMIKFSCRRPRENYQSIMDDGLKVMGIANGGTRETNFDIGKTLISVPARILTSPTLKYGGKVVRPNNGAWNLRGERFTELPRLPEKPDTTPKDEKKAKESDGERTPTWGVIVLLNKHKSQRAREQWPRSREPETSIAAFNKTLKSLGFRWPDPTKAQKYEYDNSNVREMIDKALKAEKHSFLLVLMSDGEEKAFNHLKWKSEAKIGVHTHCCKADKFVGANDQYMANNAMKVCLRLGGVCQALDLPQATPAYKLLNKQKTMVVGLDVTHPTGMDLKNFPSISAIVASVDSRLGQWPGECRIQGRDKQEIIGSVGLMLEKCIMRWKALNGSFPNNIIVYRDGVSDGQYSSVLSEELSVIKEMFRRVYGQSRDSQPRISFVIVTKRHHVRLFPCRPGDMDKNNNPVPGTVVDRGITRPGLWDFYMVAQSAIMGTARPAHYVVMHDEIFRSKTVNPDGKPADVLQELTHHICYMMGRCTRSVSYSTPAFLADKFCERARRWVKAYFQEQMDMRGARNPDQAAPGQEEINLKGVCDNRMVYI